MLICIYIPLNTKGGIKMSKKNELMIEIEKKKGVKITIKIPVPQILRLISIILKVLLYF